MGVECGRKAIPEPREHDGGGLPKAGRDGDELRSARLAVVATREAALVIVRRVAGGSVEELVKVHRGLQGLITGKSHDRGGRWRAKAVPRNPTLSPGRFGRLHAEARCQWLESSSNGRRFVLSAVKTDSLMFGTLPSLVGGELVS